MTDADVDALVSPDDHAAAIDELTRALVLAIASAPGELRDWLAAREDSD